MAILLRCAKGHDWEDSLEATMLPGGIPCPVCGERSVISDSTHQGMAQDSSDPIDGTLLRPGLAQTPPLRSPVLPPVQPSRQFESGSRIEIPPTWPTIPGYEILGELGKGGMGVVYRARQTTLGRIVALKMIRSGAQAGPEELARFHTEAQAVARLQHPNIVQIFDVGAHGSGQDVRPYMALEFVDGGSLADRLKGQPLTMNESARLVETLARAVHFAHEHGVIHRDLKPANVLLSSPVPVPVSDLASSGTGTGLGTPKVTDFGLAKTIDSESQHQTQSGQILGTPAYMAPEQASGTGQVGPHTDIYALGVILYELVTGRLPFVANSAIEVMQQITSQEPPAPSRFAPRLARDLQTIILACLQKHPARRYPSALALADDLRRFQAHEPILARPIRFPERVARWVRRRPAIAGLLLLVVLSTFALLATLSASEIDRRQRLRQSRAEVRSILTSAQAAANGRHWEEARGHLSAAQAMVRGEEGMRDLARELESLSETVNGHQAACDATAAFLRTRDEALFLATLAADPTSVERTRQHVLDAISLGGAPDGPCRLAERYLDQQHKSEIRKGLYELNLVLADLTAQRRPGESSEQSRTAAREALAILDRAAALGMRSNAYHLRKARYHEQAGEPDQAARERTLATKLPPATDLDFYLAGSEYYQRGDLKSAADSFAESLRLGPRQFWPRYFLALCHVRQGELKAARDNLTSCLGQQKVVWIYLIRGFVEGQLGRYSHAEADFEQALALVDKQGGNGSRYALYNNRAVTSLALKQYAAAENDLQRAIELEPGNYQAHVTLSQLYLLQKKQAEARVAMDHAINAGARQFRDGELDADTLLLLYRSRYRLRLEPPSNDTTGALADLQAMIDLKDIDNVARARAFRERGHLLLRLGRLDDALAAYHSALKLQLTDPEAQRWRGEVLLKLKRYREAADAFDRYLSAGGKPTVSVYRGRALARLQLGEPERALNDFTLALGLQPKNVSLRSQRGRTYLACRAYQLALADFDEALKHNPSDVSALQGRAVARLHTNLFREATADADALAQLPTSDPRALLCAVGVYTQAAEQIGKTSPHDRDRFQARALALLLRAVEQTPAEQRAEFWHDKVSRDPALRPLQRLDGYLRLERRYGRS